MPERGFGLTKSDQVHIQKVSRLAKILLRIHEKASAVLVIRVIDTCIQGSWIIEALVEEGVVLTSGRGLRDGRIGDANEY